jgi:hypothetical protein
MWAKISNSHVLHPAPMKVEIVDIRTIKSGITLRALPAIEHAVKTSFSPSDANYT